MAVSSGPSSLPFSVRGAFFPQPICKEHGGILPEPKQTKAAGRLDPYRLGGYARCSSSPLN